MSSAQRFHKVTKPLNILLVTSLVVLLLLVGSIYWLSNAVEQRQGEIEQWVSEHIGYPVSIETIGLTWVGLFPKIDLDTISVTNEQQLPILALDHLYVGVDLFSSIRQGSPILDDIIISGLSVDVVRNREGNVSIVGMPSQAESNKTINWNEWLSLAESIELNSATVHMTDNINADLSGRYQIVDTLIERDGHELSVVANILLPSQLGNQINIDAQTMTDGLFELTDWQLKVTTEQVNLAPLSPYLNLKGISVNQGDVSLALDITGHAMVISQVSTDLHSSQLSFTSTATDLISTFDINTLKGQFEWSKQDGGWLLAGRTLNISSQDKEWLPTDFSVRKKDNHLIIDTAFIELSDLSSLLSLSNELPEFIVHQDPTGQLHDFEITLSESSDITKLNFKLENGHIAQWNDYPGIDHLTAQVTWNGQDGSLTLNSTDLVISSPVLLENNVSFSRVVGDVKWQKELGKWSIKSTDLTLNNTDMAITLNGDVVFENANNITTNLALALNNVKVNTWKKYVPQHILSDDFKEWSEHAFVAGIINDGVIKMRGSLTDFPFESETATNSFSMALNVSGAQLHYGPGWPDITNVNGTINTQGTSLVVTSKSGGIAGFKFGDVTTSISRFMLSNPILTTVGYLDGTTQQALNFLKNSPLKERFESVSTVFKATGNSRINLDLMVPLINVNAAEAIGDVSFINSEFQNTMMPDVIVKQVNGLLAFNNNGVNAKGITGQFFDKPVTIDVKPDNETTVVEAKSTVTAETLAILSAGQLPSILTGEMPVQLNIEVSEKDIGDFYVNAYVNSDLIGMTVDLPEPLTKNKTEPRVFRVSIENQDNALVFNTQYGELVHALVRPTADIWQGEIRFGLGKPTLPANGIKVRGHVAQLSVDDWLNWSETNVKTGTPSPLLNSIDDISVSINSLVGFNQSLSELAVSGQKEPQGWRMHFSSQQSKGSIYLPKDLSGQVAMSIEIDNVALVLPDNMNPEQVSDEDQATKHVLWPAINLDIEHLEIDKMVLGKLHLAAIRTADTWSIKEGSLISPSYSAQITSAQWLQSASHDASHINVSATSDNLSGFLADFGYLPSISSNNVTLDINASWPSSPLNIERAEIKGNLALSVGRGKLNDVEPGAAGRIFGLLSITAIPRRLSLDFSELFSKGFNFSSITANFELESGIAKTKNMKVLADSATIDITGPIDIVNQTYNQKVAVVPNVSSSLPIAGAVAGGPIGLGVGTAILLVDKLANQLFDKNIGNLITYKYDLTGPWNQPELKTSNSTSR
jgi:uncharacterized protein (TIGR02099 family)